MKAGHKKITRQLNSYRKEGYTTLSIAIVSMLN